MHLTHKVVITKRMTKQWHSNWVDGPIKEVGVYSKDIAAGRKSQLEIINH